MTVRKRNWRVNFSFPLKKEILSFAQLWITGDLQLIALLLSLQKRSIRNQSKSPNTFGVTITLTLGPSSLATNQETKTIDPSVLIWCSSLSGISSRTFNHKISRKYKKSLPHSD